MLDLHFFLGFVTVGMFYELRLLVCVEGSFDGNSMKVAELLFKDGFKEAYAIKDGVRGKKGWLVCLLTQNF